MKLLAIIFCLGLLFASCKKNNETPYRSDGVLTGYDLRICPSLLCGGLLITIKNDTAKNPPSYYHINSSLAQMRINENTRFPINVNLNYKKDTGILATYNYIIVTKIRVVK